jgi:hypothetical protein
MGRTTRSGRFESVRKAAWGPYRQESPPAAAASTSRGAGRRAPTYGRPSSPTRPPQAPTTCSGPSAATKAVRPQTAARARSRGWLAPARRGVSSKAAGGVHAARQARTGPAAARCLQRPPEKRSAGEGCEHPPLALCPSWRYDFKRPPSGRRPGWPGPRASAVLSTLIDLRAQPETPTALRTDTPLRVCLVVVDASGRVDRGIKPPADVPDWGRCASKPPGPCVASRNVRGTNLPQCSALTRGSHTIRDASIVG